jgi:hypothetical protein
MLDSFSTPSDVIVSYGNAEATSCSVTDSPGLSVCATISIGTEIVCVSPSNVTGTGVTRLPNTRPVVSSTSCAYTWRLVPEPEYVGVSCGAPTMYVVVVAFGMVRFSALIAFEPDGMPSNAPMGPAVRIRSSGPEPPMNGSSGSTPLLVLDATIGVPCLTG